MLTSDTCMCHNITGVRLYFGHWCLFCLGFGHNPYIVCISSGGDFSGITLLYSVVPKLNFNPIIDRSA